jgi:hypothetical protein
MLREWETAHTHRCDCDVASEQMAVLAVAHVLISGHLPPHLPRLSDLHDCGIVVFAVPGVRQECDPPSYLPVARVGNDVEQVGYHAVHAHPGHRADAVEATAPRPVARSWPAPLEAPAGPGRRGILAAWLAAASHACFSC